MHASRHWVACNSHPTRARVIWGAGSTSLADLDSGRAELRRLEDLAAVIRGRALEESTKRQYASRIRAVRRVAPGLLPMNTIR